MLALLSFLMLSGEPLARFPEVGVVKPISGVNWAQQLEANEGVCFIDSGFLSLSQQWLVMIIAEKLPEVAPQREVPAPRIVGIIALDVRSRKAEVLRFPKKGPVQCLGCFSLGKTDCGVIVSREVPHHQEDLFSWRIGLQKVERVGKWGCWDGIVGAVNASDLVSGKLKLDSQIAARQGRSEFNGPQVVGLESEPWYLPSTANANAVVEYVPAKKMLEVGEMRCISPSDPHKGYWKITSAEIRKKFVGQRVINLVPLRYEGVSRPKVYVLAVLSCNDKCPFLGFIMTVDSRNGEVGPPIEIGSIPEYTPVLRAGRAAYIVTVDGQNDRVFLIDLEGRKVAAEIKGQFARCVCLGLSSEGCVFISELDAISVVFPLRGNEKKIIFSLNP